MDLIFYKVANKEIELFFFVVLLIVFIYKQMIEHFGSTAAFYFLFLLRLEIASCENSNE